MATETVIGWLSGQSFRRFQPTALRGMTSQTLGSVAGSGLRTGRPDVRVVASNAVQIAAGPVALAHGHAEVVFQRESGGARARLGRNLENGNIISQWFSGTKILDMLT